ncbi:hypothetical protein Q7A53_05715 [Halobacillus rhizosphaerae]|uniref:hypothetical protein n=1 Tax=Halobacillus rhizosphaerae TaxID=3064889 RepID=UPI00398AFCF9
MGDFEYDVITVHQGKYECDGIIEWSLLKILNKIGYYSWELVGEIRGEIIVKRRINEEK